MPQPKLTFSQERVEYMFMMLFEGGIDDSGYVVDSNGERLTNNNGEYAEASNVKFSKPLNNIPFHISDGKLVYQGDNPARESLADRLYPFSHDGTEGVLVTSQWDVVSLERVADN